MQRSSSLVSIGSGGSKMDELPTYNPLSEVAKKEASKAKLAERMVHAIPLVLFVCAVLLWFFSYPDFDVAAKAGMLVNTMKNMTG